MAGLDPEPHKISSGLSHRQIEAESKERARTQNEQVHGSSKVKIKWQREDFEPQARSPNSVISVQQGRKWHGPQRAVIRTEKG